MKKFVSLLLAAIFALTAMSVFAVASGAAEAPAVPTVKAAYGTPVIDGTIDDVWKTAEVYSFDVYDFITKADASASVGQFRALWDETYLYLLYEIKDTTMCTEAVELTDTNWIGRDGVGMTFAPSNERTSTAANKVSSFWFIMRAHGTVANYATQPQNVMVTEKEGADAGKQNDFTVTPWEQRMYKCVWDDKGYTIEMKVNLNANNLTDTANNKAKMEAGSTIGFDTWVYGNDCTADKPAAGRHHMFVWGFPQLGTIVKGTTDYNAVTAHTNNTLKGQIELLAKTETVTTTEAATTGADATTTAAATTANVPSTPSTGDMTVVIAVLAVLAVTGTAIAVVARRVKD
ncbi:MAG: hypothetical protein J5919_08335 [Clostridia bacterium]|nr:hypothetical protein [Clostridia bacterium]